MSRNLTLWIFQQATYHQQYPWMAMTRIGYAATSDYKGKRYTECHSIWHCGYATKPPTTVLVNGHYKNFLIRFVTWSSPYYIKLPDTHNIVERSWHVGYEVTSKHEGIRYTEWHLKYHPTSLNVWARLTDKRWQVHSSKMCKEMLQYVMNATMCFKYTFFNFWLNTMSHVKVSLG